MSQVSEIIVKWTPEASGRVSSIQIQSRIAGTQEWTEQAGSFDPKIGEFRFTSNAPATDVEVRVRYRMLDGIYSGWSTDHVVTAPAGVIIGEDVLNGDGTVWVPPAIDLTEVQSLIDTAKADLEANLADVASDVVDAKDEAQQARTDLAAEVTRAQGAEGALNTSIVSAQTTADGAVTLINDKVTLLTNADTALANRSATLEAQMAGTQASNLSSRISTVETATTDGRFAAASRATALEAQLAGTQSSALQTRISNEEIARTGADTTLGNRASALESQMAGTQGSALLTRISTEETTRLSADTALANRSSLLESTIGAASGALNANPAFSVWDSASGLPFGWAWWTPTTLTRIASPSNAGGYIARIVTTTAEGGFFQTVAGLNAGDWCVIDVTASLQGGTWQGAGVTMSGVQNFNFAALADVAGTVSSSKSGVRRWSFLFQTDGSANFHPMANWSGFGTTTAKTIDFYRCSIRPATAGEIAAQKANTDIGTLTSRISTEETTRSNADSALATRANALEAQMSGTQASNLLSRIQTVETATTDGRFATASRAATLEAQMAGTQASNLSSRISTVETATTDGRFAAASSLSSLSSSVGGLASTVSTQGSTIADLQGRAAAYWSVQSVAGSGRAQLTVHADANGGGGVDIVGDVRITGSSSTGTTLITGNGIFGFYANGVPAFKLGLI
ncbi:hypothetical protein P6144_00315 [Sphingomonas sp. HITSZ_GF]|uniref:hypothetical protein n=1 Tax=Sphingomonas sp. HITSZ_GF TaxID=3037247 RepID=UPI00240DC038|nr:hypothetical protein [Sphingomonas sp. HITSZ_GF]MDG2532079.1 hypothetical protein [Sphingomonas sp. HITSZ_GF]